MVSKTKILITGASGYIGNCLFYFLKNKFNVIGIDSKTILNDKIFKCNILNIKKFDKILSKTKPDIIIHLAAQSLVDETINKKKYYKNNIVATNYLLKLMEKNNIKKIIFSSTAAIYQQSPKPLKESAKLKPISIYAKTKLLCEKNINKQKNIKNVILRFFNVCSALEKPIIGELHNPETHLIPTIVYKAIKNKRVYIYGKDFPTPDGTCVRDYVHIKDVCLAIEKSIKFLLKGKNSTTFNIGNCKGLSNYEIINYMNKKLKRKINIKYVDKRKGDVSRLVCNSDKARKVLSWIAINSNLRKIIYNEINWIKKMNKLGFERKFRNYLKS
jgi:UDP-glucose 4-epimerase